MEKLFSFRWMSLFSGLAAIAVFSTPAPLYAQGDYDLQMQTIESHPLPLEGGCYNQIKPHFSINGADDHFVPSGGAFVHFRYRTASQPSWVDIGDLPVTYVASDGPLASGELWPDSFGSVSSGFTNGNSIEFVLPSGDAQVSIEATVNYGPNQTDPNGNAIVDTNPGDNTLETTFNAQLPASCTLPPPPTLNICKLSPAICNIRVCNTPGCVILKIDPENCPMCGGGPIEVIVDLPPDLSVIAYTRDNREVARSAPLGKAVRVGDKTYSQKLVFESQKGESYSFKVVSQKGQFGKVLIKPDIQIRKIGDIRKLPDGAIKRAPIGGRVLIR